MTPVRLTRPLGQATGFGRRQRRARRRLVLRCAIGLLPLAMSAMLLGCDEPARIGEVEQPVGILEKVLERRLVRIDGERNDFGRHSGKAIVINVWATWCPPCRAELPSLQRLSDRLDPERFSVVGLSVDEDPDFVREYLRDVGVDFANYLDSEQDVSQGVLGVVSLPQTLLVRADGALDRRIEGVRDWDAPETRRIIEALAR